MPIYEYKCSRCKNQFQAMQKFSDAPILQCPTCGGDVKKLISRSSFHLKGSGWYLTDYAKKNSSASSCESESVSSPSTDTKTSTDD
jgi:putative FmdB family regulatory protein